MRIIRENAKGGRFLAPIAVNAKISFIPVGRRATEVLELHKNIVFPPLPNQRWQVPARTRSTAQGFLLVDTDGDNAPDTYLPGTSNFGVVAPRAAKTLVCPYGAELICHLTYDCEHCVCEMI
jgi:hypothetical protein